MKPRVISRSGPHEPRPGWVDVSRRGGKWGNPFRIGRLMTRDGAVARHAEWIRQQPRLMASLNELRGKDLVCFCSQAYIDDGRCHAVTLLHLANKEDRQ